MVDKNIFEHPAVIASIAIIAAAVILFILCLVVFFKSRKGKMIGQYNKKNKGFIVLLGGILAMTLGVMIVFLLVQNNIFWYLTLTGMTTLFVLCVVEFVIRPLFIKSKKGKRQ